MTAALDGTVAAWVLGPAGLVRQAFVSLLGGSGIEMLDEDDDESPAVGRAQRVAVLVEPAAEHWTEAEALSAPVVLVVDREYHRGTIVDAVLRGAEAVLHVDAAPEALVSAIRVVAAGGTMLGADEVRALAGIARAAVTTPEIRLTPREIDIVESIAKGHAVKQTARSLGISAKTVENLQSRLFRKLGVHNRAQAVAHAHAMGVV